MKTVIKTLLATVAISLLGAVTTGMCASAAVSKGVENTIAWTFDSNTATLTLDKEKSDVITTESWMQFADQVQYIEIAGMNLGAHMGYDDPDFYPNLKKVYGSWHNPEKSWKEGDPELLWEIDYTGSDPVITLDAEGDIFAGETAESFTFWDDIFSSTYWWNNAQDGGRFVLGDGISGFSDDIDLISGVIAWDLDVVEIGKNVPVSNQFALLAREEYIVDPANPYLATYNGALYTKDYRTLLALPTNHMDVSLHPNVQNFADKTLRGTNGTSSWEYDPATKTMTLKGRGVWSMPNYFRPFNGKIDHLVISDGITKLNCSVPKGKTVSIGKDFQSFENGIFPQPSDKIELSSQNSYLAMYDDALYTKDYRILLSSPTNRSSISIHPDTKIIASYALSNLGLSSPIIVPWGVTRIEAYAFSGIGMGSQVTIPIILPDTLEYIGAQRVATVFINTEYFFSPENKAKMEMDHGTGAIRQELLPSYLKGATTIKEIYERVENGETTQINGWLSEGGNWYYYQNGVKATGWQLVSGIWYYLGTDGTMQTGWMKAYYGTYYYLRPWGGMMANGWYQVGGKWYYFRDWGGMVQNSWIYGLDKKWYYVGADGAMLTNTRTPDGYYVNAAGVWIP